MTITPKIIWCFQWLIVEEQPTKRATAISAKFLAPAIDGTKRYYKIAVVLFERTPEILITKLLIFSRQKRKNPDEQKTTRNLQQPEFDKNLTAKTSIFVKSFLENTFVLCFLFSMRLLIRGSSKYFSFVMLNLEEGAYVSGDILWSATHKNNFCKFREMRFSLSQSNEWIEVSRHVFCLKRSGNTHRSRSWPLNKILGVSGSQGERTSYITWSPWYTRATPGSLPRRLREAWKSSSVWNEISTGRML